MLPLNTVSLSGELTDPEQLERMLVGMQSAGVDGFMVDVWWGITEPCPKLYNFEAYHHLMTMARNHDLKVQIVTSFHQCGGNFGDDCYIPLPSFVSNATDIWYKDAEGFHNTEYISLFADAVPIAGRTPLEMYADWFSAFAAAFSEDLGSTIVEVMVGLGPCGELRYPSYPLGFWNFCGIGEFQCYDQYALASLKEAAAGRADDWQLPPGSVAVGSYNSKPEDTEFFTSGFASEKGKFFLEWYSAALKTHAAQVLSRAKEFFGGKTRLAGKVAGIHWWYDTSSHAAEATAGYYNTNMRNAYAEIADVFAAAGDVVLDFTCLEMRNSEQPSDCKSNPEWLVKQAQAAAVEKGVLFSGENALQRYDNYAYEQMLSYKAQLSAVTYLRLSPELLQSDNFARFRSFVQQMHSGGRRLGVWEDQYFKNLTMV
ncbi:unnamed protein product [Polarella glacialis]|uniref:Beta-amylase n=1 Tax=Polarella glacialis TaxID=89957 RepID=A0A813E6D1_POLGL|nr:unnamed protein product [Polarella glacialis]